MTWKNTISTLIKLTLSSLAIWYVLQKVSFAQVLKAMEHVSFCWIVLAFVLFVVSKLFSVARLQHLFKRSGIPIDFTNNMKLYWLGMFYNQFLPGGVGGDVYKAMWISKQYTRGKVEMAKLILWDRLSGMVALLVLLFVLAGFLFSGIGVLLGVALSIGVYIPYVLFAYRKKQSRKSIIAIEGYSYLIQFSQFAAAFCLMCSLSIQGRELSYLVLFLVSSVASVVPLTLGGIGAREFTFMIGSGYLAIDSELAITIGFLFYIVSLLASLGGAVYLFIPLDVRKEEFTTLTKPLS